MLDSELSLVDATITDLLHALDSGAVTSVELVSLYLNRIGKYDCRGPTLNSVCILNPDVFAEAQASDDHRASGRPRRALEGIPFTVKDSYKVKGMTVAAGSPAFADLVASSDSSTVKLIRDAGGILIGRTNMPPMADGGCQRGAYGRAQSPYNLTYLTSAFVSGSSNGSGTSTAASFAAFGMAGETVSSGRSPASNNALVAYAPSRGIIPAGGTWPLYPTCDVVVPHTRTVQDLLAVLDILVTDEADAEGDFWREQRYVPIPLASEVRPDSYQALADPLSLHGKHIGVPRCYIGKHVTSSSISVPTSDAVLGLWQQAKADLEKLGATVVETDFPLISNYDKQTFPGQSCNVPGLPEHWVDTERCQMIALSWDDFLRTNNDPSIPTLAAANPDLIHPLVAPMDDPTRFTEAQNQVRYADMQKTAAKRTGSLLDLPGCAQALEALERARITDFETWLDAEGLDLLVFPTNADVGRADSETSLPSMLDALRPGVKYSNGGRALKHLGVPAITVPMGTLPDKQMPVGLTLLTKAYADADLLRYAFAYEHISRRRSPPPLTPALPTDTIRFSSAEKRVWTTAAPALRILSAVLTPCAEDTDGDGDGDILCDVVLTGELISPEDAPEAQGQIESLAVCVNGSPSPVAVDLQDRVWSWAAQVRRPRPVTEFKTPRTVPSDCVMVTVVAKTSSGRGAGGLVLLE